MTIIAHNSLCSTRAYHLRIDLSQMPLFRNVACNYKKFLRSRKIYLGDAYQREGESVSTYPRGPKAEVFDNAVDVVELLLVTTDQAPNVRYLRVLHMFSSITSLEILIQQSVEGELRQHDGVVTAMVK